MKVFLDLDGVIADFVGGVLETFKKESPYGPDFCGEEAWDLPRGLQIPEKEFWEPLGYDFWFGLKKTEEADKIIDLAKSIGHGKFCFLTSPCNTRGCMEGKVDWVKRHYPDRPVFLAPNVGGGVPKEYFATYHSVLIDDHTPNVIRFSSAGGNAFLVPRPWNEDHHLDFDDWIQTMYSYDWD